MSNNEPKATPIKTGKRIVCDFCGKTTHHYGYKITDNERSFIACSQECAKILAHSWWGIENIYTPPQKGESK